MPYVSFNPYLCVAFMTLSLGFNGACVITNLVNPHDLSPNYATSIIALTNAIGNTSGFITPLIVGQLTKYNVRFYYAINV